MDDLDKKIFEANQRNIAENMNFSQQQVEELKDIIRKENRDIVNVAKQYKDKSDFLHAVNDPSKPNFRQYCELGAKTIDSNKELSVALNHADNRINFMYEVGRREAALQSQQQQYPQQQQQYSQQQYPQQQQQYQTVQQTDVVSTVPTYAMTPEPQQGAAPYSGDVNPASVPWNKLSMKEFEKLTNAIGNPI